MVTSPVCRASACFCCVRWRLSFGAERGPCGCTSGDRFAVRAVSLHDGAVSPMRRRRLATCGLANQSFQTTSLSPYFGAFFAALRVCARARSGVGRSKYRKADGGKITANRDGQLSPVRSGPGLQNVPARAAQRIALPLTPTSTCSSILRRCRRPTRRSLAIRRQRKPIRRARWAARWRSALSTFWDRLFNRC